MVPGLCTLYWGVAGGADGQGPGYRGAAEGGGGRPMCRFSVAAAEGSSDSSFKVMARGELQLGSG